MPLVRVSRRGPPYGGRARQRVGQVGAKAAKSVDAIGATNPKLIGPLKASRETSRSRLVCRPAEVVEVPTGP